jgi:hypothetical protein
MISKAVQTKRAVMMELVLVLILAFVFAYSRMHNPVPASAGLSVPQLVDTPAPVPSWTFSVMPDSKHGSGKAKVAAQVSRSLFAAKPAPAPVVTKTNPDVTGPLPVAASKHANIPAPEATATIASKTAVTPALETVPEPTPVAAPKHANIPAPEATAAIASKTAVTPALETVPEPAPVAEEALAVAPETESLPMPKELPASVLSPVKTTKLAPEETTQTTSMVGGTTAALILAPIAAPVAIIFGIAAAMFTPTSSQLGQDIPPPASPKKSKPSITNF